MGVCCTVRTVVIGIDVQESLGGPANFAIAQSHLEPVTALLDIRNIIIGEETREDFVIGSRPCTQVEVAVRHLAHHELLCE